MQPPSNQTIQPTHVYEVRPSKDHRGANLISDALLFGRLWYAEGNAIANAIGYAKHRSRSDRAVIRVYDAAGNVICDARACGRLQGVVNSDRTKLSGFLTLRALLQFF
jgi:hypothetical protein